jgi:hypothetical protein
MVTKVISGRTVRGVLSYNENKVKEGSAECIYASGFAAEAKDLRFNAKLETFRYYMERNTRVRSNTLHVSLNFDPKERLDKDKLTAIATSYIDKIGFKGQPYLVYQHNDAAHPHLHLVTTNIRLSGERICLKNIGRNQSEKARKEIEIEFGLVKAQGKRTNTDIINAVDLSRAIYGKSETKRAITNTVNAVTRSYRFTSIHELNAVLKQYNITADRGKEGTMIHSKNGLRYSLIDKNGDPIGVPIKASSIYGQPTLAKLTEKFSLNELLRGPHKDRVRTVIDSFDGFKEKTLTDFVAHMVSKQIYPVLRQNDEGRIYGMTFIDNSTRCVFNGSALGKQYSAQGILNRFEKQTSACDIKTPRIPAREDNNVTAQDQTWYVEKPHSNLLKELTEGSLDYSNTPYEMRRKKRRGRSI